MQVNSRIALFERIETIEKEMEEPPRIEFTSVGFRGVAETLDRVAFRAGLVASMRAKLKGTMGVMVSGGYREESINGVKFIEPDGQNLDPSWHEIAELVVNSMDVKFSLKNLNELAIKGFPF